MRMDDLALGSDRKPVSDKEMGKRSPLAISKARPIKELRSDTAAWPDLIPGTFIINE